MKNNFRYKVVFVLFIIISNISIFKFRNSILGRDLIDYEDSKQKTNNIRNHLKAEINHKNNNWIKINNDRFYKDEIIWEKLSNQDLNFFNEEKNKIIYQKNSNDSVQIFNRSIVFNNNRIGPDISWIVPPGLPWNKKYKLDFTARGHNTQIPEPTNKKFFDWNDGDATGLLSYQFLHNKKSSFGLNLGIRSLYQGDQALGGHTSIGEGLSAGFRWDYTLSKTSGFAFGAEQLVHFDDQTDTGRNLYLTFTKGWWSSTFEDKGIFPLYLVTSGIGTGRMAVGPFKGLCSNLIGGSGTEIGTDWSLCWSPVFSLSSVWNEKFSTFFEYNSRFFILGSSYAPLKNIPLRGTFGLLLSDHVDNYKLHNSSEMNWVFNISIGF